MNLLYVGCSVCRNVVPLFCGGQFMPHAPVPTTSSSMGFSCQICGLIPPFFICTICWTRQMLYLPGSTPTQMQSLPNQTQYIAPVIQANPRMGQPNPNTFSDVAKEGLKSFGGAVGKALVEQAFRAWVRP